MDIVRSSPDGMNEVFIGVRSSISSTKIFRTPSIAVRIVTAFSVVEVTKPFTTPTKINPIVDGPDKPAVLMFYTARRIDFATAFVDASLFVSDTIARCVAIGVVVNDDVVF